MIFLYPKRVLLQPQIQPEAPGQPHSISSAWLYTLKVVSDREAVFGFRREDGKGPEGSFPEQLVPLARVLQTDSQHQVFLAREKVFPNNVPVHKEAKAVG